MENKYEFLEYKTDAYGITTITLNRAPVNAFNGKMSSELIMALDRFEHAEDNERVLVLTGAGRFFSAGEDLNNIDLNWSNAMMGAYAKETLGRYHMIVRNILSSQKPIIAALNGVAAGSGVSIALACDYRFCTISVTRDINWQSEKIFSPAFADMGLIADAGMIATSRSLLGRMEAQKWCEHPGFSVSFSQAFGLGVIDSIGYYSPDGSNYDLMSKLEKISQNSYRFSKKMRNKALIRELNEDIFPWEMSAQTACLQSVYFREKARAFLLARRAKK